MARGGRVMIERKPALMALALLAFGLSALAATHGSPIDGDETSATACSSCDARHQNHTRLLTKREAETTP